MANPLFFATIEQTCLYCCDLFIRGAIRMHTTQSRFEKGESASTAAVITERNPLADQGLPRQAGGRAIADFF